MAQIPQFTEDHIHYYLPPKETYGCCTQGLQGKDGEAPVFSLQRP